MPAYQWSPFVIPPASTALLLLVCALRIATRFSRATVGMFSAAVAAAGWQVACVFMYLARDPGVALIWAKIGCASMLLMAPALYQLVDSLIPASRHRRIMVGTGWLIATQLGIVTLTTGYLAGGVTRYWWGFYPAHTTAARLLYLLFFGGLVIAAAADMIRAWPHVKGTERERIRLFAIALGIGCIAAVDILAMNGVDIYPFGWIAMLASTALVIYTVTKLGMVVIDEAVAAPEIIETMRDLLLVSDRDGRIMFANNAACSFLGYGREDIKGLHLEDLLIPTTAGEPGLVQGWARDREYVFRTRMGQPIELTLSHSPVMRDGEVTGAVVIGRDLRERKRYEWEARRAVTLLQSTLDSTADGILVIADDGRASIWNERFTELWGLSTATMEQEDDQGLIGHLVDKLAEPAEFLDSLASLHEHPDAESVDLLWLKDGRRLEHYSIGRFLDNQLLRIWSFRDVTAKLAAEEALRDSEARYRLLFEQNAAGVCLATSSGRIISCNATLAEMVGHKADALIDRDLQEIFERPDVVEIIRARLNATQTVRGLEIELRSSDGERVSALANVSLLGAGERALLHMTAVDITDRKRAEELVEFQAYHDALTLLPNRRLFVERLGASLAAAKRSGGTLAVMFIDLDRFKTINDTLGHAVADGLLKEIAARLQSCVEEKDTVARYGGDEFTVIFPDPARAEDVERAAKRMLERVFQPVIVGSHTIEVSVSIGIALFPQDGEDMDSLLRSADDAMYRAKQAGRNNYQMRTEQQPAPSLD